MRLRSRWAAAFAVLAACMLWGCEVDKQAQPWPSPGEKDIGLGDIPLKTGFYRGRVYHYWDAGTANAAVSYIFILYRQGSSTPIPTSEQYPIVSAVPDSVEPGLELPPYSPFRHVINVTVPASYVGNTLTSVMDLANALYLVQAVPTYLAWDAPSVLQNATLGGSPETPMPVWFNGRVSYVFKLGENIAIDRSLGQVSVVPVYEIFRGGERVSGNTIFSMKKDERGYSPLSQVIDAAVSDSYPVGGTPRWQSSIAVDLNLGGYLIETTETDSLRNYPYQSVGEYSLSDSDLGYVDDSDPDQFPGGSSPETHECWYNRTAHTYSDLGHTEIAASDVWQLYRTGAGAIAGQDPIVRTAPGDSGYSAIRRVHEVYLDASAAYTPNSIKSYDTLLQTGAPDSALTTGWDAPAVNHEALWNGQPPLVAWVRGMRLPFYTMDQDIKISDGEVNIMQGYEIYRQQNASDTVGIWLRDNSLVAHIPGQDGYSPVRQITRLLVRYDYPDSLYYRSYTEAATDASYRVAGGQLTEPGFANRPVNP